MKAKHFLLFMLIVVWGMQNSAEAQKITKGEYFIDTDPGVGNGTQFTISTADTIVTHTQSVSIAGLNNGIHTLVVRLCDSTGTWGLGNGRTFYVFTDSTSQAKIQSAEYYLDNDPGVGNANALNSFTPDTSIVLDQSVDISSLSPGFHTFNARFKMNNGIWSQTIGRSLRFDTSCFTTSKITDIEYFFASDSGSGKGQSIASGLDSSNVFLQKTIDISSLSTGFNSISVRAKNNLNIWSNTLSQSFLIISNDTTSIVGAEYYLDSDVGVGNGIPINIGGSTKQTTLNVPVDISSISQGFHQLTLRMLTSSGTWGLGETRTFVVSPIPPDAPIKEFEYFFDTDSGVGTGQILPIAEAYDVNADLVANLGNLPSGDHYIYIRAKDTIGNYSLYEDRKIHICDVLPIPAFTADSVCYGSTVFTKNLSTAYDTNTVFSWDFNNDGIDDSVSFEPTYKYAAAGTYSIRLIASNGGLCGDTAYSTVLVTPPISSSIVAGGVTTFCDGDSVTLTSAGNYKSYLWSNGATTKSITVKATGSFALVVDNGICNATSAATDVTVYPMPDVPVLITSNGAVFSSALTGNQWYDYNKGIISGETNNILIPFESGTFYTIVTQNGCSTQSDTIAYVYDSLNCYTDYSYIIDQQNLTVSFSNLSSNSTSVKWKFGDGSVQFDDQNPVHVYPSLGKYTVCMISIDSISGCLKQVCKDILIGDIGCSALFSTSIDNTTKTVQFTDNSTGTTEWFWDFGDGTVIKTRNATHTFGAIGYYQICHWVRNTSTGCFDQSCEVIKVGSEDTIITNADFLYFAAENSNKVTFSNKSSSNVTSFYWTFGDGGYSTDENPLYTYVKEGTYNVCLKVFDKKTGKVDETCQKIVVGAATCSLIANFSSIVKETKEVIFYNNSTGDASSYYWNFGDGTTSTTKHPTHTYEIAGYYLVSLAIRNNSGTCTDYYSQFIQVGITGCQADFTYLTDPASTEVSFQNASKGDITKYFWSFGNGKYSVEENPVFTFDKDGMYRVTLTASNLASNCMDNYTAVIQVGKVKCNANFTYFVDSVSNTVYFKDEVLGNSTNLLWSFGDGSLSTKHNPSHKFLKSGYYKVGLNTFDGNDWCMDYFEETILVGKEGNDCKADFIYLPEEGTTNVSFVDKSSGDIIGYIWNLGEGTIVSDQNPVFTYNVGGYYNVCQMVVNSDLITNIACKPVVVSPGNVNNCKADFNFTVDSANLKAYFTDISEGNPNKWEWNFGNNQTANTFEAIAQYSKSGYYLVGLKIMNTSTGCVSKAYKLINIAKEGVIKAGFAFEKDTSNTKAGGYPVDFVGAGLGDQARLRWDFGDGNADSTTSTPTHEYTQEGTYKVCYEISDPVTGKSDSACQYIQVGTGTKVPLITRDGMTVYPNPFSSFSSITFTLSVGAKVELTVLDMDGRRIESIINTTKPAGLHKVTWDGSHLAKGTYLLQLKIANSIKTKMLIKQ